MTSVFGALNGTGPARFGQASERAPTTDSREKAPSVMTSIKAGDEAPNFTTVDDSGRRVSLSEFKGKWVVLFFYPKDDTPG
jgi:cytochrome oxidase Cu insertion factor (SCO1/SenC/PrrC family)